MTTADSCPVCGATRAEIQQSGHRWLDSRGRVAVADTQNRLPCPEGCSCIPQHFSREEHAEYQRKALKMPERTTGEIVTCMNDPRRIASGQLDTFKAMSTPQKTVTFYWIANDLFRFQWLDVRGDDLGKVVVTSIRVGVREQLAEPWRVSNQPRWLDGCPSTLLAYDSLTIDVKNEGDDPVEVTVTVLGLGVQESRREHHEN